MRVLSASIGSLPESTHGSSGRHQPLCTMTSSPTFTFFTSLPVAQTMPEQSLPPAWTSSVSLRFFLLLVASTVCVVRAQLLPLGDDVEWLAERGPDIVVVDARGHDVDQHLVGADRGRRDHLTLPGIARLAEPILPDEVRVHPRRNFPDRRSVSQIVELCHGASGCDYLPWKSARLRSAAAFMPALRSSDSRGPTAWSASQRSKASRSRQYVPSMDCLAAWTASGPFAAISAASSAARAPSSPAG